MTAAPGGRTAVEADLADQLGVFAREFVATLDAQGRLVEVGGVDPGVSDGHVMYRHGPSCRIPGAGRAWPGCVPFAGCRVSA
ncbi:hypothetical protein AB0885_24580 [Streptomyces sp. NPDC005534]|uniref:hypothetical protein n=1 Tax=Streptomyces sp. NPDC005534 TaxID=3155714 RepID=UPI0034529F95